jgi:protein-disulfide isomerase-like protein with CxxC motif
VTVAAFFFDPLCPWAYRTSLWLREVSRMDPGVHVEWRFFSLEEVNLETGKRHPWEREWSYGWSQMRVAALLRRQGHELVDRWYGSVGDAFFDRGEPTFTRQGAEAVLESIGLPSSLVGEALNDETTNEEIRADHTFLRETYGGFGVPTIVVSDDEDRSAGRAMYGPVLLTPPTGSEALRLWRLLAELQTFPDLFEIGRPKTGADMEAIRSALATYGSARQWRTVQNPAP